MNNDLGTTFGSGTPFVSENNSQNKCPVCGKWVSENTIICPHCNEQISGDICDDDQDYSNLSEQNEQSKHDERHSSLFFFKAILLINSIVCIIMAFHLSNVNIIAKYEPIAFTTAFVYIGYAFLATYSFITIKYKRNNAIFVSTMFFALGILYNCIDLAFCFISETPSFISLAGIAWCIVWLGYIHKSDTMRQMFPIKNWEVHIFDLIIGAIFILTDLYLFWLIITI